MRDTEVMGRVKVQLIYPNDLECNIKGLNGTIQNTTETPVFGVWDDEDSNSPLFGIRGVLRVNNMTVRTTRVDSKK